ncbi:thiamine pyrophosphate-requiring protein [bacterium]|nr:thiamine pyrophosphate-requiring protein [bacterium]
MKKKVGHHLVDLLDKNHVDYLIGVAGTEFATVIEKFSYDSESLKIKPLTVAHEYLAVNMAYGCYLASGRLQAVMVHSTIGTLNCAAAVMNAQRMQIPLLLIAGRTATSEKGNHGSRDLFIHWAQESFDQASPIREFVKWDYELRDPKMLQDVVHRAISIAMEEPRGPVYLTIPREMLLDDVEVDQNLQFMPFKSSILTTSDQHLEKVLELIQKSKRPLIITNTAGKERAAFCELGAFIDLTNIPMITPNAQYNHGLLSRPEKISSNETSIIKSADLILCLDIDVPWIPSKYIPSPECQVVHISPQPLFNSIPIRGFRSDLNIYSNVGFALERLNFLIKDQNQKMNKLWSLIDSQKIEFKIDHSKMTKQDVEKVLAELWNDNLILINELGLPTDNIPMDHFGCYYRTGSASGLGWACGVALGLGIMQPEKTVINVVGDGAYYFGNPLAYHAVANQYNIPIITLILNNRGMFSIAQNVKDQFFDVSLSQSQDLPFLTFKENIKYEKIADIFGFIGYQSRTTEELKQHLQIALESNLQTVINVII